MKILTAAVSKITRLINFRKNEQQDMASLTEGYLRRYPVRSFGIPVASVDDILLSYKLEIKKLIPAAAIRINSEKESEPTFNRLYKKTIENLAGYVHLLPASEYHHHHELGGLFYHSLQTAHGCLEKARSREGKIPRDKKSTNIDVFQVVKPKWIYGAWALGLIHDIGKVIMDITVYEHGNETNVWSPLNESLVEWAKRTGVKSYETRMTKDRQHGAHEEVGALLVKEVISNEGIEYLRGGGPLLMNQLYQYMSGKYIDGAFLHQIVKHVDGLETARDINLRWDKHLGESRVNVEKIFISSARSLLPTFKANEPKGKIFICGGRAFVTIAAIDKIIAFAKQENYKQFPGSTKEFCEALMEAGVVEPIRDKNGEVTDEWFGLLKPSIGNEYRVIKLVSPIVIYWEGENPRSIPGEFIVGNTGVKEIYAEDGAIQIKTDGEENDAVDESEDLPLNSPQTTEHPEATTIDNPVVNQSDNSQGITTENISSSNAVSAEEMASHEAAMQMYMDEDDDHDTYGIHEEGEGSATGSKDQDVDVEIPRPKTKKPSLKKDESEPKLVTPPKLDTYEPEETKEDVEEKAEAEQLTNLSTKQKANSNKTKQDISKGQTKTEAKTNGEKEAKPSQRKTVKRQQKGNEQKETQKVKATPETKGKAKRRKLNQLEAKLSDYLAKDISKKMNGGDVIYIDNTFALSVHAISEIASSDYMQALPQLKARGIISSERGVRKVEVKGEEKVMVVINQSLVERIVDDQGIDVESIAIIERETPSVKDKNNRKADLIANSEVAENKDDYSSQVQQLIQNIDAVIEEDDGVYVEYSSINQVMRRITKDNQQNLQAAIAKSHEKEIDDKTFIRILERCDER